MMMTMQFTSTLALLFRRLRLRASPLALTLVAALALAALAPSARAQGTMGAVPDPISSRELDQYAHRVGLSPQQRAALEQFQEQYKAQFSALREGEIEKFLNGQAGAAAAGGRGMGGRGMAPGLGMLMGNVDRKAIEETMRQLDSINDKIRSLDTTLFDQIQTLLTDDQIALLTSVRQTRERSRYRTGLARMASFNNPGAQVDLTELIGNLSLTPDERSGVTPLVSTYESALTADTRKLHDTANASTLEMIDKLAAAGVNAQALQNAGQNQNNNNNGNNGNQGNRRQNNANRMMDSFRQVWGEVMGKINEHATAISELNRRTERSLVAALSPDNARKLKDDFFRRAYPELRGSTNTQRAFEVALKFDDLTAEQRTTIQAMYDQYMQSVDRLNDEMADAIDAQRKTRSAFDFGAGGGGRGGGGGGGNNDDKLNKLREQRQQLTDSTRQQVEAAIGPDLTAKLQKRVAESRGGRGGDPGVVSFVLSAPAGVGIGGGGATFTARVIGDSIEITDVASDQFVPPAISGRDIEAYAKRLGLDQEHIDILTGLHTEYTDHFKQIDDSDIQPVREAQDNLWQRNDNGPPTPPTPEAVDHLYALRRKAIESVKALDSAFFNDVQMALVSEQQKPLLDRVRQSRLRAIYNRGSSNQGLFTLGGGQGGRRGNNGGGVPGGGGGGRGGAGGGGGGPGGAGGGGGGAQRAVFFAGGPGGFGGGGSSEATVDLSLLVEQSPVTATDPKSLDASLVEYENAATPAFQTVFESAMRLRQATDRVSGQFSRGGGGGPGGGGGDFMASAGSIRDVMDKEGKIARDASQAVVNLNRQSLERIVAFLAPASADQLKQNYNRKAFPDVYRDNRSAQPRIDAALALEDLTDQQRQQVQAVAVEFRSAYDTLCDQMIELEKAAPSGAGGQGGRGSAGGGGAGGNNGPDPAELQAMQERMRNREKLTFERNDLSDKMIARLRGMLTDDQVQRLGLDVASTAGSF